MVPASVRQCVPVVASMARLGLLLCVVLPASVEGAQDSNAIPSSTAEWSIDGRLVDPLWKDARRIALSPLEAGVPGELGGYAYVVFRGDRLCLGASLPEPYGRVQARSIGYNPVWEQYALTSPPVEDRIIFRIAVPGEPGDLALEVAVNPWGGMRVEQGGLAVPGSAILRAASVSTEVWGVEAAVPLGELSASGSSRPLELSVMRIRSRRPLSPEFTWRTADAIRLDVPEPEQVEPPSFDPPTFQNQTSVLEVGRVRRVPPLTLPWDAPFWEGIPGFELPRNEASSRPAEYPTRVKWVHDGSTLQVFFENAEDERLDADIDSRDGNIASDDHVVVYLATSGSSTVEILCNPVGAIRDALSRGPRAYGSSPDLFNGRIQGHFLQERERWMVRLNLPLNEIADALGECEVPRNWRILVGRIRRERPGEPAEVSTVPVLENPFLNAPARFSRLLLSDLPPTAIAYSEQLHQVSRAEGAAGELQNLSPYAFSRVERKYHDVANMVQNWIDRRTVELAMEEHREWDRVETLQDWESFRDRRIKVLRDALGPLPEERLPLDYRVNGVYRGEGYQVHNIAYQSRRGFYVAANLYLPEHPPDRMPAMIILPAHHYPKSHGEMKDSGMIWARCGVAVLVMEHIGFGERLETSPLYRQAYESEYLLSTQLETVGQSLEGWVVYDVMRTVDLFEELGNIDMDRVVLLGSVTWGGGRQAAPAGLLDERIDAEIIYNFGRVYWYGWGIRNMINNRITPWFIVNAFAPRKLVYAHEFWYEGEEGPEYPSVWVPAWPRYKEVYGLYGAEGNVAIAQGEGILRVGPTEFVPAGDCYMLGPVQRESLYPILERWFRIPYPSEADRSIPKDSGLGDARRSLDYAVIRYREAQRRPSDREILSIPASVTESIPRRPLHAIAAEIGARLLSQARADYRMLSAQDRRVRLAKELREILGDVEPLRNVPVTSLWERELSGSHVEALVLESEPGIQIPSFLITPKPRPDGPTPVVLALGEGGKSRFLQHRAAEIQGLTEAGFAVCIPDVRGTGETAPDQYNLGYDLAQSFIELGGTLLGSRLKDVRSILVYLQSRADLDGTRISIWGDGFAPVNVEPIWVDELKGKPVSPQIQHFADPLGAHLALLAGLYHPEIRAVAARGGLQSYFSLLESPFNYIPPDSIVPRILTVGDVPDIVQAVDGTPVHVVSPVTARNFLATEGEIEATFPGLPATAMVRAGSGSPTRETSELVQWLVQHGR